MRDYSFWHLYHVPTVPTFRSVFNYVAVRIINYRKQALSLSDTRQRIRFAGTLPSGQVASHAWSQVGAAEQRS